MMMINTPLATVKSNNANGLPLAILTPLITLDKRLKLVRGKVRTENGLLKLVRIKEVRAQVRTKNALSLLVSNTEVSIKVSTRKALFKLVAIKEVARLIATENRLLTLVSSPVSTKKAFYKWIPEGNNRAKGLINHAYQKGKSYLWQATDLLSRIYNEDAFNCHLNGYKVTKTVTPNLYRNSKPFTNMRKVCIEFSDSIKKGLIIFRHVRKALAKLANYLLLRLIFSRQALITQAEKLLFSFLAIASICSISSWGKRMFFFADLLLTLSLTILKIYFNDLLCAQYTTKRINKKALTWVYSYKYTGRTFKDELFPFKLTMPRSALTLSRHLTKPLNEVMIMANRYDSAPVRAEQSKVFKFYNTVTAQVVQTIATTERQAKQQLGNSKLIFIARTPTQPTIKPSINVWGFNYA